MQIGSLCLFSTDRPDPKLQLLLRTPLPTKRFSDESVSRISLFAYWWRYPLPPPYKHTHRTQKKRSHRTKQQRQCRPAPACARKSPPRVVHSKETRQDGRHRRRDVQPLASSTFFPCWRTVPLVSGGARYEAARMLLVLVLARAAGNLSTSPTSCLALFMPASKTHHTRRDARPPTTCASLLHTTNTDG